MGNPAPTRARKIAIVGSSAVGKYIYIITIQYTHFINHLFNLLKMFILSNRNILNNI